MKQHEHELLHELLEERERLIALLEQVEWVQPMSNSSQSCSCCGNMRHWHHAPDCELALAIGSTEIEEPPPAPDWDNHPLQKRPRAFSGPTIYPDPYERPNHPVLRPADL
jgi:hypothetical protein